MSLRLDWCSHEAAKYAVEKWHYSHSLPTPPLVKIGVWESERFIGCVLFGRGATQNLGKPYGLTATEVCELVRVALTGHYAPVSQIVSIAIRFLRQQCPGLRLIVSFADPDQGHVGAIYQAGNWLYLGRSTDYDKFKTADGRVWHPRQVSATGVKRQYGEARRVPKIADCERVHTAGKHRYLMPLDAAMRAQIAPLAKPYPKRPASIDSDASGDQPEEGGAAPTAGLHQEQAMSPSVRRAED